MEKPIDELNPQQQVILNQAWFLIRRDWALKFKAKQEQQIQACVEEFRGYCRDIRQEQLQGRKGKIGYITYSMLRTTWLEERPIYLVEAANALWVLDSKPIRFEWDTSWTYSYWTDLQQKLRREVEKQHVSLPELEWEQVMLEAAVHIHVLVVNMMRLAIKRRCAYRSFRSWIGKKHLRFVWGIYGPHYISV